MHTIVESMSTLTESAATALQLTFSAEPALWTIVGRSLSVSATACLLACGAGLVLGAWLVTPWITKLIVALAVCVLAYFMFTGR